MKLENLGLEFPVVFDSTEVNVLHGVHEYPEEMAKHILKVALRWRKNVVRFNGAKVDTAEVKIQTEKERKEEAVISDLKIDDLKIKLEEKGLSTLGNRNQLMKRLIKSLEEEKKESELNSVEKAEEVKEEEESK